MLEIYGKTSCSNCVDVKKELDDKGIEYKYTDNTEETMKIAKELHSRGELISQMLPLIIKDGKQILINEL